MIGENPDKNLIESLQLYANKERGLLEKVAKILNELDNSMNYNSKTK